MMAPAGVPRAARMALTPSPLLLRRGPAPLALCCALCLRSRKPRLGGGWELPLAGRARRRAEWQPELHKTVA